MDSGIGIINTDSSDKKKQEAFLQVEKKTCEAIKKTAIKIEQTYFSY